MHADNSHYLITAAQRRHETTRAKATQALRDLDREGGPVTFQIVAQKAQVSRSWLYTVSFNDKWRCSVTVRWRHLGTMDLRD